MKKSKNIQVFPLRLPKTMVKKLDKVAEKNGASRNAEITRRLNNSLQKNIA